MAEVGTRRGIPVLLVEDQAVLARLTGDVISDLGHTLIGPARSMEDALRLAAERGPRVALVDLSLPDGGGDALIGRLQEAGVRCAVLSGSSRLERPDINLAGVPWVQKPVDAERLAGIIDELSA